MPSERIERDLELDAQILLWRDEGATFTEIGRRLGVSRQRAQQLWDRAQEPYTPPVCWCGQKLAPHLGRGRPRKYCSPEHVRKGFVAGERIPGTPRTLRLHKSCTGCQRPHPNPTTTAMCTECGVAYRARSRGYGELVEQYGEVCGICGKAETLKARSGVPRRLAIDHDHATGKIRGLLCGDHNRMLGMAKDQTEILLAAVDYLRKHAV